MADSRFKVPLFDEMPSDEMIDWLHENPNDWEGDESGIALSFPGQGDQNIKYSQAFPGDYVVRNDETMEYWCEDAQGNRKPFL